MSRDPRITPQPMVPQVAADTSLSGHRAVVIGGGTGAPVSIGALLSLGVETSAVVAMADDGGSTGLLRERAGAIPPGDIRRCIIAMAADPATPFAQAFNYRLDYADDHALGNLILTALADVTDSFSEAIHICEELFAARGHVYPSTLSQITLDGVTRNGRKLRGQANIAHSTVALRNVCLSPADPEPYEPALDALRSADFIVLGPGSLYTSIIPNLLVPGILDAIRESAACTLFICSLGDMQGETGGLDCLEHVEALLAHGMEGLLDIAVIHRGDPVNEAIAPDAHTREGDIVRHVLVTDELLDAVAQRVGCVLARDLVDAVNPTWHDPERLRNVFKEALALCPSLQR